MAHNIGQGRLILGIWNNLNKNIALQKKLAHLLFDFGIVNRTDDDCE